MTASVPPGTDSLRDKLDALEPSPDAGPNVLIRTEAVGSLVAALRSVLRRHVATEDPAFCDDCMAAWPCRTVRDIAAGLAAEEGRRG